MIRKSGKKEYKKKSYTKHKRTLVYPETRIYSMDNPFKTEKHNQNLNHDDMQRLNTEPFRREGLRSLGERGIKRKSESPIHSINRLGVSDYIANTIPQVRSRGLDKRDAFLGLRGANHLLISLQKKDSPGRNPLVARPNFNTGELDHIFLYWRRRH
jgi:hypothetical protein